MRWRNNGDGRFSENSRAKNLYDESRLDGNRSTSIPAADDNEVAHSILAVTSPPLNRVENNGKNELC